MAIDVGDSGALGGMTKDIYDKLNELLKGKVPDDQLTDAQAGWKEIAFAVATGVVGHLLQNLEITGLQVTGSADLTVAGGKATGTVTLKQDATTKNLVR
jgi:hypothetical protein